LIVYIYDVTNSQLIEPSSFRLLSNNTTLTDTFVGNFQTSATVTEYRLIFHVASGNTPAWTLGIDELKVVKSSYTYGTPITDWVDFPSVAAGTLITGSTTNPTFGTIDYNQARWRRVGSDMEIVWQFRQTTAGTNGNGDYYFNLPAGFSIDLTKTRAGSGTGNASIRGAVGTFSGRDETGPAFIQGTVFSNNATRLQVSSIRQVFAVTTEATLSNATSWRHDGSFNFGTQSSCSLIAQVPIQGWSSSVRVSDGFENRDIVLTAKKLSNEPVTAGVTNISYTAVKDTTGSWNGTQFRVPSAGDYYITLQGNGSAESMIKAFVNGVNSEIRIMRVFPGTAFSFGSALVPNLKAGDLLSLRSDVTSTINGGAEVNLSIFKLQSPQTTAQGEVVAARYSTASGTAITSTPTIITYDTREFDTHAAMSGSTYTVPTAGLYQVFGVMQLSSTSWSTGVLNLRLFVNGTFTSHIAYFVQATGSAASASITTTGATIVRLNAGDQLTFRGLQTQTTTVNLSGLNGVNYIAINKVG
jgi:hypothetical protein